MLVAEGDDPLRSALDRGLQENGYIVDTAADGNQALVNLRECEYEVVVLDWEMPSVSGIDVVRHMRRRRDRTPVLMLKARGATADRVAGTNLGADDCLVKPFDFAELVARLRALRRRPALALVPQLVCGNLVMDTGSSEVTKYGELVALNVTELSLLDAEFGGQPAEGAKAR